MNFSELNKHFRLLTLVCICFALFAAINSGMILTYLHPRSLPLVKISWVIFVILTLNEFRSFLRRNDRKTLDWRCFAILLPIIAVIYVKPTGLSAHVAVQKGLSSMALTSGQRSRQNGSTKTGDLQTADSLMKNDTAYDSLANGLTSAGGDSVPYDTIEHNVDTSHVYADIPGGILPKMQAKNDTMSGIVSVNNNRILPPDTIKDDSFGVKLQKIYTDPSKWSGKSLTITGFIAPDTIMGRNSFFLARMMISCCAADAMPVGFYCVPDSALDIHENDWVVLTGKEVSRAVKFPWEKDKHVIPLLRVTTVQRTQKPEREYVYPFAY